MNRRTKIHFPVFGTTIRVIVVKDVEGVRRSTRRLGHELTGADAGFIYGSNNMVGHIVLMKSADVNTLVHEAYHAICAMFKAVGMAPDEENVAYHLGTLCGRLHRFLNN